MFLVCDIGLFLPPVDLKRRLICYYSGCACHSHSYVDRVSSFVCRMGLFGSICVVYVLAGRACLCLSMRVCNTAAWRLRTQSSEGEFGPRPGASHDLEHHGHRRAKSALPSHVLRAPVQQRRLHDFTAWSGPSASSARGMSHARILSDRDLSSRAAWAILTGFMVTRFDVQKLAADGRGRPLAPPHLLKGARQEYAGSCVWSFVLESLLFGLDLFRRYSAASGLWRGSSVVSKRFEWYSGVSSVP